MFNNLQALALSCLISSFLLLWFDFPLYVSFIPVIFLLIFSIMCLIGYFLSKKETQK